MGFITYHEEKGNNVNRGRNSSSVSSSSNSSSDRRRGSKVSTSKRNHKQYHQDSSKLSSTTCVRFVRQLVNDKHLCTPHHNYTFGIDFNRFKQYAELYKFATRMQYKGHVDKNSAVAVIQDDNDDSSIGKQVVVAGSSSSNSEAITTISTYIRSRFELCEYNARVATKLGCNIRTQAWKTLGLLLKDDNDTSITLPQTINLSSDDSIDNIDNLNIKNSDRDGKNMQSNSNLSTADLNTREMMQRQQHFGEDDGTWRSLKPNSNDTHHDSEEARLSDPLTDEQRDFNSPFDILDILGDGDDNIDLTNFGIIDMLDLANPEGAAIDLSNDGNRGEERYHDVDHYENKFENVSPILSLRNGGNVGDMVTLNDLVNFGSGTTVKKQAKIVKTTTKAVGENDTVTITTSAVSSGGSDGNVGNTNGRDATILEGVQTALMPPKATIATVVEAIDDPNVTKMGMAKDATTNDEFSHNGIASSGNNNTCMDQLNAVTKVDESVLNQIIPDVSQTPPSISVPSTDPILHSMHNDIIKELLNHYCEQGDVQMCSTIALILGPTRIQSMFPEYQIQQWHNAYVEQLMSLQLFVVASDVMIHAGGRISEWNQKETTVYTACKQCGNRCISLSGVAAATSEEKEQERIARKHAKPSWLASKEDKARVIEGRWKTTTTTTTEKHVDRIMNNDLLVDSVEIEREVEEEDETINPLHHLLLYRKEQTKKMRGYVENKQVGICDKCQKYITCIVCERPVRGPLVWRSKCGHGGHLDCMEMWRKDVEEESAKDMAQKRMKVVIGCPAGCDA